MDAAALDVAHDDELLFGRGDALAQLLVIVVGVLAELEAIGLDTIGCATGDHMQGVKHALGQPPVRRDDDLCHPAFPLIHMICLM